MYPSNLSLRLGKFPLAQSVGPVPNSFELGELALRPPVEWVDEHDLGGGPLAGHLGKGCLVDRTIPIHARTLGLGVPPHVMGMYYRVVRPYSTNRSACC